MPSENGQTTLKHNTARPFAEPHALIQVTNDQTGEKIRFRVNEEGSLPAEGITFKANPGDTFSVAISDGTNNLSFLKTEGRLKVPGGNVSHSTDLKDPNVREKHKTSTGLSQYGTQRFMGDLTVDGIRIEDVEQGAIANCYFAGAVAAIAHTHPEKINKLMKENTDGTVTFTFMQGSSFRPVEKKVTVDRDLYSYSYGAPVYGRSLNTPKNPEKMELWFSLLEKAYASFKGDYSTIGEGGTTESVMLALLGKTSSTTYLSNPSRADSVFESIQKAAKSKYPMIAATYGKEQDELYKGTRLHSWHVYTVMDAMEVNGEKMIQIRNPWGKTEPGQDGKDDGIFLLKVEDFIKYYSRFEVTTV